MESPLDPASFEKLGAFYLGRVVAPPPAGRPFLYDARHLTTHAVVIGMTGSGKTGLSIALLEEAAIDGIPAIVVDPKGDLGNLLLQFPSLGSADFAPWAPHGSSADDEARRWKDGLAAWGQDGARIERLKSAAEIAIYTPGSRAGRPISIAGSLAAPSVEERADAEAITERVGQVALSLLGLVGIQAEPGKSREHVLLATILKHAWDAGESLDLAGLVVRIQDPPFTKLGVLGLEQFFPKKERFELAVAYNALLATPGFDAWLDGTPLDVGRLLWTKEGKPRIAVLSIAHLDDAQRMFFVSLLLGQMLAWMRTQPGTPALRALFFMDEVVGYFPPVAMPPSKRPLLVLLKQARAFGLGIVLATQNPVDLDYKGLANAGTWMIGRLQTERDKARVLEGLEGAAGGGFKREAVDTILSSLAKRNFYVHDVHAELPAVIESRWTLSYLRGPLTKDEIKKLSGGGKAAAQATVPMAAAANGARPVLAAEVPQVFFPTTNPQPVYRPFVVGAAKVHFADEKTGLDFTREVMFVTPLADGPVPVRWEDAKWAGAISVQALAKDPVQNARFVEPPADGVTKKSVAGWEKELVKWLTQTQGVARLRSKEPKLLSRPGEDERAFRARLQLLGREARDEAIEEIRASVGKKLATLDERIRKKQGEVARGEDASRYGFAEATFDLFARGPAAAAKRAGRAGVKAKSTARDKEDLSTLFAKRAELQSELQAALAAAAATHDAATMALETVVNKPKKTGISVHLVALAWRAD